jgi:hypothetical protein
MKDINQTQIEKIVRNAIQQCSGKSSEWIETEQLFTILYGDNYLKIKRKLWQENTLNGSSGKPVAAV